MIFQIHLKKSIDSGSFCHILNERKQTVEDEVIIYILIKQNNRGSNPVSFIQIWHVYFNINASTFLCYSEMFNMIYIYIRSQINVHLLQPIPFRSAHTINPLTLNITSHLRVILEKELEVLVNPTGIIPLKLFLSPYLR